MTAPCSMLSVWLLCFTAGLEQSPKASMFVSENTSGGQFTFTDGVLEVKGGRGWLRTPRLYSNFRLSLEFRAVTADADAALVLRSLASQGEILEPAYRVALPQPLSLSPSDVLSGPRNSLRIVKSGRVEPAAQGVWQRLTVVADLNQITVTLNDIEVGVYELESFVGYMFFTSKKGHLQIRNVVAQDTEPTFTTPATMLTAKDVLAAGGTAPKVRRQVKPYYSIEPLHQRKISGVVWMEAVVLPDGKVGSVRVTRPLDPDLDQSAVGTVRRWEFTPGMLNGSAVPVLIEVEMSFAITK